MWLLAYRQLLHESQRSGLSILAIASAISVILILAGFEQGLYLQSKNLVEQRKADLFVTQAGVENFHIVRSSLGQTIREKVEKTDGVKDAHPVTGLWVIYSTDTQKMPVFILVYDKFGGPTRIVSGTIPEKARDIVIDMGIAKKFNLKVNDVFTVFDYEFNISGITLGQSAIFSPMGFITYDGLLDLIFTGDISSDISAFPLVSFLLVETKRGVDNQKVALEIEKTVSEVDVFTPDRIANKDVKVGQEMFGPIMKVLIFLSYIIGLLIIMMIVYAEVATHKNQFGILKALGFTTDLLVKCVVWQLCLSLSVAVPLGLVLAYFISLFIEWYAPVYSVYFYHPETILYVVIGTLLMSLVGGLYPLRGVVMADPVEAFKREFQ